MPMLWCSPRVSEDKASFVVSVKKETVAKGINAGQDCQRTRGVDSRARVGAVPISLKAEENPQAMAQALKEVPDPQEDVDQNTHKP